jgi:hypothetical protein
MKTRYLAVLATLACLGYSVPAAAHECDGHKNKDHKHCPGNGNGGGGTNTRMPVTVTFRCPGDVVVCGPRVFHDAINSVYTDGEEGVFASISNDGGGFNFHTGLKKNKVPTRQFVFDYENAPAPAPSGGVVPLDPPAGPIDITTSIAFNYNTHIQVNRRRDVPDLRLMTKDVSEPLDMWFDLTVYDGQSGSGILGRFDATSGNNCPLLAGSAGDVSVKRTQGPPDDLKFQWVVTASAGLKACVTAPFERSLYAEAFDMGDFEMVLTEL